MPDQTVKKIVEVSTSDYDAFIAIHPQYGAWTWFIREALSKYIALQRSDNDSIDLAVREISIQDSLEEKAS